MRTKFSYSLLLHLLILLVPNISLAASPTSPAVLQRGTVTAGHCVSWSGNNFVQDSGGTCGGVPYPSAGIPLSTGSAWGTSITNNSSNWNTAYGWGNHASAGYFVKLTDDSDDITQGTVHYFVTLSEKTVLGNTTGSNSGDETTSTIKTKLGAANTTTDGYLTSTDWNTFNNKLSSYTIDGVHLDAVFTGASGLLKKTSASTYALDTTTYAPTANPTFTGSLTLSGSSSGTVELKTAAAAGTGTVFQLPSDNGTNNYVLKTDGNGVTSWVAPSGSVSGTGTSNYVSRWTGTTSLGTGALYDNGTLVGIGTGSPASSLSIYGGVSIGTGYAGIAAPADGLIVLGSTSIGTSTPVAPLTVSGVASVTSLSLGTSGTIYWGSSSLPRMRLSSSGNGAFRIGDDDQASPYATSITFQNVNAGIFDAAGADITFNGSKGTGTGAGGAFIFKTSPAGTTGSSQNAGVEAVRIPSTGGISITGATTITSTSTTALAVGTNGASYPSFLVDLGTTSPVNGIKITGRASGSIPWIDAVGPDTNIGIEIWPKGSGTLWSRGSFGVNPAGTTVISMTRYVSNFTPEGLSTGSTTHFLYSQPTDTNLAASTESKAVYFNIGNKTRTHATGALALQSDFVVTGATHAFAGASTVTNLTNSRFEYPGCGTNASCTNISTLYIPTKSLVGTTQTTNSYGLNVEAATGATNNYSAIFTGGSVGIGTSAPAALLHLGADGSSLGTIRLAGNTSGYTQIQPSATAGSWTMTLPVSAGTSGYVLQTDGSGVTSWVAPTGSVTGTGTSNYVSRWTGTTSLGTGVLYDNGSLVGVGTNTPASLLSVHGGVSVGTGYSGIAAPTGGLIIQGNVGIGTSSSANPLTVVGVALIDTVNLTNALGVTYGGTGATSLGSMLSNTSNVLNVVQPADRIVNLGTDTLLNTDGGKNILYTVASAVTIPDASSAGFTTGYGVIPIADGSGDVVLTTTPPDTINGAVSLTVPNGLGCAIYSDGTNILVNKALCPQLLYSRIGIWTPNQYFLGSVGIGTTAPASKLSVYGGVSIGTGYSGTAAPTDGLIVSGNVGIGSATPANALVVAGTAVVTTLNLTNALSTSYGGTGLTTIGSANQLLAVDTSGTALNYISSPTIVETIGITVDGGNSAPTTGQKGYYRIPYDATIIGWTMISNATGSAVFDVWKANEAKPTVSNTITSSAKPTLTSDDYETSTTLTGWTTTVSAGDVIGYNLDSATTLTRVTLQLSLRRRN